MSTPSGSRRRGLGWALVGGAVLLAGVIAIVVASLTNRPLGPSPMPSSSQTIEPTPSVSASTNPVVDETVAERGWVPEPITTDPDAYMRAALAAASSFDPALSTRDEWLAYLDTWLTPDIRYTDAADRQEALEGVMLEVRQSVVLPEEDWNSLSTQDGRVAAEVDGAITDIPVLEDPAGDMRIGTADVILVFVVTDDAGEESSSEQTVRVSVQVLCGPESVPTPDSAQSAGDCKVVRFFSEPLEP